MGTHTERPPYLGHDSDMNKMRLASVNQVEIRTFFTTASQMSALTGGRFCFKSFAPSTRCYFSFCELMGGGRPSPVTEKPLSGGPQFLTRAEHIEITRTTLRNLVSLWINQQAGLRPRRLTRLKALKSNAKLNIDHLTVLKAPLRSKLPTANRVNPNFTE